MLPAPAIVPEGLLADLTALYEHGRILSAWRLGVEKLGPLAGWRGTEARILAARILGATGAPRRARRIAFANWRADRRHPVATYYAANHMLDRFGPADTLRFMKREGIPADAEAHWRASWLALRARALSQLRDFDSADRALREAGEISREDAWVEIERARVLQAEDRYDDALAAAEISLRLRPFYRPAVYQAAELMQMVGRDLDALELLRNAAGRLEDASVVTQLAGLESALGAHAAAAANLRRSAELYPEMELDVFRWFQARLSDEAWECGDLDAALEHGRNSQTPYHLRLVSRVETRGRGGRRAAVPIAFVRQHHMTCVPATLSAISAHWKMPANHLQVAEEICYDGTPAHSERRWATQNGYAVREFRLTWQGAVALIDRGVPFTLTTVGPGSGHLQAAFGYDEGRGALTVRDPTFRNSGEIDVEGFIEEQRASGPRCMALVPVAQAAHLEGIELQDADLYDQLHAVDSALSEHRRERASAVIEEMRRSVPGHRLTLQARRALAMYDDDPHALLECLEALLAAYPGDVNLVLAKSECLQRLGRRREALEVLGDGRGRVDPLLQVAIADQVSSDARQHEAAASLLRRAIHANRTLAPAYQALADVRWNERRREDAVELYRHAACLDDKNEHRAWAYFTAARHLQRTDEALAFLEGRFRRYGGRAGWPGRTLFRALEALGRTAEAFKVLERAVELRPDDGDLSLFAADAHARFGRTSRGGRLMAAAEGNVKRAAWRRQAAAIASYSGEPLSALQQWLALLESEPLAMDAHENAARLLADVHGTDAAIQHLDGAAARFPHHTGILALRLRWLRQTEPARALEAAQQLCEAHPSDAWARRELALALMQQGKQREAFAEIDAAARIEPDSPSTLNVRGSLHGALSQVEEARRCYRESLELAIDQTWTIDALLGTCVTAAERRVELDFIREQLQRQVVFGSALLEYQAHAAGLVPDEELAGSLAALLERNRDLWQAWSALARQLLRAGQIDRALETAKLACDRFSLVPQMWRDLAGVHAARSERDAEKAALGRALALSPGWADPVRQLAAVYTREGNHQKVRELLERAIAASPGDVEAHARLAEALDRLGVRDEAVARLEQHLRLNPSDGARWDLLVDWSGDRAARLARDIAVQRPHSADGWLGLARALPEGALEERLAALASAEKAAPRSPEVHDLRAWLLAEAGRFDDAAAACTPAVFGERQPTSLRGRAAWVRARRGDVRGAVEQMGALVAQERDYHWGHRCLIGWSRDLGDKAQMLAAAEQFAAAFPRDASAHAAIGEAVAQKDAVRARRELSIAFAIDPGETVVGQQLFDLEFADRDIEAAAATLSRLQRLGPEPFVAARAVRLACFRRDAGEAARQLNAICDSRDLRAEWPIQSALDEMRRAGWRGRARRIVSERVLAGTTSAVVAVEWARRAGGPRVWSRVWRLDERLRTAAVRAFVKRLRYSPFLLPFVLLHRRALHGDVQLWASVGFALVEGRDWRLARRWMSRYQRDGVEPWMIVNVVCANAGLGRWREADYAVAAARRLPAGETDLKVLVWNALRLAIAGDVLAARAELERCASLDDRGFYTFARKLAEALCAEDPAGARERMDAALALRSSSPLSREVETRALGALRRRFPRAMRWQWLLRRFSSR